ncbi:Flavin mononucleotide hydrolase 1, chloroplatic [Ancistrocladus abbreviatus]
MLNAAGIIFQASVWSLPVHFDWGTRENCKNMLRDELARKFFKDGRQFDLEGLKLCMKRGYHYIDGVDGLLYALKQNNYEIHALTNYPVWYEMIEEKLRLSAYLSWTFCSCITGKRKPDPEFYVEVLHYLEVQPSSCIFIDDRVKNVEAAMDAGMVGIHFKNAQLLHEDLCLHGADVLANEMDKI